MKRLRQRLRSTKGSGYIDMAIFTIVIVIALCAIISIVPVFFTKLSLDNYANELVREAEISGNVGAETTNRLARLNEIKGVNPTVQWSKSGHIQMGTEVTVTVSKTVDFGFYIFGNYPISITSTASGISEVLWKS